MGFSQATKCRKRGKIPTRGSSRKTHFATHRNKETQKVTITKNPKGNKPSRKKRSPWNKKRKGNRGKEEITWIREGVERVIDLRASFFDAITHWKREGKQEEGNKRRTKNSLKFCREVGIVRSIDASLAPPPASGSSLLLSVIEISIKYQINTRKYSAFFGLKIIINFVKKKKTEIATLKENSIANEKGEGWECRCQKWQIADV